MFKDELPLPKFFNLSRETDTEGFGRFRGLPRNATCNQGPAEVLPSMSHSLDNLQWMKQ